jgi:hypothetical protein
MVCTTSRRLNGHYNGRTYSLYEAALEVFRAKWKRAASNAHSPKVARITHCQRCVKPGRTVHLLHFLQ